jgi:nucleotide-binding universal stress UspA family protein
MKLILHPTDGSAAAKKALDLAAELAAAKQGKLIILHVQRRHGRDSIPPDLAELEYVEHIRMTEAEVLHGAAETIAAKAEQAARAKGVAEVERLVVEGDPAREIIAVARDKRVDAIVLGSRGLGDLQGLLLGSVSHKVAQVAPCTCIMVR